MFQKRALASVALIATFGTACSRAMQSRAGDIIDPVDAASSAVLEVRNLGVQTVEIRTVLHGDSRFVGAVAGNDKGEMLLDPSLLPTGSLWVVAIPTDGRDQVFGGPLAVTKGDTIRFTVESGGIGRAVVVPKH